MRRGNMPPFVLGDGKKFCTTCQAKRPDLGGHWEISEDGLTRRWSCAVCETHKAELAQRKELAHG